MNTRKDAGKQPLSGAKAYTITFKKGELPPVDGFWSITCTMRATSSSKTPSTAFRSATGPRA